jgi:hypothetical protein
MPYTGVEELQFEFTDDGIRHMPTGALFVVQPGETTAQSVDWANAGRILENGHYYDLAEIQMIAEILLARRGAASS